MATIETVNFKAGRMTFSQEHVNVSDIVGVGGSNEKFDVMLIQALFKLVELKLGGFGITDLPEPTGFFDGKTGRVIWEFQKKWKAEAQRVDGKIHPGNYKNRVIQGGGRRMTITLLNNVAYDELIILSRPDLITTLKRIAPQLVLTRVS
ncbi:MAG: hypothetical protein HOP18_26765 [Deltaproteobacteria bacterium]|nr:hypothetical protein [Deltaproteobacteria bacterium]